MIGIKAHNNKWRIVIKDEEWEAPSRKELDEMVRLLLDWKEKYGKIISNEDRL